MRRPLLLPLLLRPVETSLISGLLTRTTKEDEEDSVVEGVVVLLIQIEALARAKVKIMALDLFLVEEDEEDTLVGDRTLMMRTTTSLAQMMILRNSVRQEEEEASEEEEVVSVEDEEATLEVTMMDTLPEDVAALEEEAEDVVDLKAISMVEMAGKVVGEEVEVASVEEEEHLMVSEEEGEDEAPSENENSDKDSCIRTI
jgi:hypothetical protein